LAKTSKKRRRRRSRHQLELKKRDQSKPYRILWAFNFMWRNEAAPKGEKFMGIQRNKKKRGKITGKIDEKGENSK